VYSSVGLDDITSQKMAVFMVTAERTSYPATFGEKGYLNKVHHFYGSGHVIFRAGNFTADKSCISLNFPLAKFVESRTQQLSYYNVTVYVTNLR
jgi:hypothetical protein